MSIPVLDFYESSHVAYGLHVLTGHSGMTHEFRWMQLCEDPGNITFMRGGELVVTTGLAAHHRGWLENFVRLLIEKHATALIINVGKYIKEEAIPEKLLLRCRERQFPILTMPWKSNLASLMQECCARLFESQERELMLTHLLSRLLTPCRNAESLVEELSARGFAPRSFVLAYAAASGKLSESEKDNLFLSWRARLNKVQHPYMLFFYQKALVYVMEDSDSWPEAASRRLALLESLTALPLPRGLHMNGGLSAIRESFLSLPDALREARAAFLLAQSQKKPCLRFTDLGTYRLLFTHPDRALLASMRNEKLSKLLAYDARHQASLLDTLRVYLETGGSPLETAARTFTHRNTVRYRIAKIEELTGEDLSRSETRFTFLLALLIHDTLRLTQPELPLPPAAEKAAASAKERGQK